MRSNISFKRTASPPLNSSVRRQGDISLAEILIESALAEIDRLGKPRPFLSAKFKASENDVSGAEAELGLFFPDSYRYFLLTLGSGDIGGVEFCGLIAGQPHVPEASNALWISMQERQAGNLPTDLWVVEELGDGAYACVELQTGKGQEGRVVLWEPSESVDTNRQILASTFGQYFQDRIHFVVAAPRGAA